MWKMLLLFIRAVFVQKYKKFLTNQDDSREKRKLYFYHEFMIALLLNFFCITWNIQQQLRELIITQIG